VKDGTIGDCRSFLYFFEMEKDKKWTSFTPGSEIWQHQTRKGGGSLGEVGLLANRYAALFADSISMASFYTERMNVDSHDVTKVIDVDKLRQQFVREYTNLNVNTASHPLKRRFCDTEFCDTKTLRQVRQHDQQEV